MVELSCPIAVVNLHTKVGHKKRQFAKAAETAHPGIVVYERVSRHQAYRHEGRPICEGPRDNAKVRQV